MSARKATAIQFLQTIVAGDVRGAFARYAAEHLRHHNPYFPGDAASLCAAMEEDERRNPGKVLEVVNALEDGDRVAVHSRLRRPGGQADIAVVHLFRFEGDRIAEAWDVAMLAPDPLVNEHGLF